MTKCAFFKLPGECSENASILFRTLCSGHVSHCFRIGQKQYKLPSPVARSISQISSNDSLGAQLTAEWTGLPICDDIVFNENDTVIAFSEYKDVAFIHCSIDNETQDDISELAKQRHFAQVLAAARYLIKCASCFSFQNNRQSRNAFLEAAVNTYLVVRDLANIEGYSLQLSDLLSRKPFYITKTFRLSKPFNAYKRNIVSLSYDFGIEPKPWEIMSAVKSSNQIAGLAEQEYFRHFNASNFVSGDKPRVCHTEHPTELSILSSKLLQRENEIYVKCQSKEQLLCRLLRRPLLNQYDDSDLGTCHRYYITTFPDILTARVLSAVSMLSIPISTIKRPYGKQTLNQYLEYFCDENLFDTLKQRGVSAQAFAKYYAHAFAIFDGLAAKDHNGNNTVTLPELEAIEQALGVNNENP